MQYRRLDGAGSEEYDGLNIKYSFGLNSVLKSNKVLNSDPKRGSQWPRDLKRQRRRVENTKKAPKNIKRCLKRNAGGGAQ